MTPQESVRWKLSLLAAFTLAALSLIPQLDLWLRRGAAYQGAYAYAHYDEDFYAAYLNALILGRPRRTDPLIATGYEGNASSLTAESFYSVQVLTPAVLATMGRLFNLTTSQIFQVYSPLLAIASLLILFLLLCEITRDERLSALGSFFVLCFGTLAGRDGKMIHLLDGLVWYAGFPFLRRYQPGLAFPLFFVFVLMIWRASTQRDRTGLLAALMAGVVFVLLVFGYLFVWTSALAWLSIFSMLWLVTQSNDRRAFLKKLSVVGIAVIGSLGVYLKFISGIASNTASGQALERTHTPDLLRGPELIGLALITFILLTVRRSKVVSWRDARVILALSFCILPIVVFNQQLITGVSLQPFHYEIFIANYVVLIGAVLVFSLSLKNQLGRRAFWCLFVVTLAWGITEIRYSTIRERERNLARDAFVPVAERLNELTRAAREKGEVVFSPDTYVAADNIAGYTSLAPFWCTHKALSPSLTGEQREQRFFEYLYYRGETAAGLAEKLRSNSFVETCALLGYERSTRHLTRSFSPVSKDEIEMKKENYSLFLQKREREAPSGPPLSYLIVPNSTSFDYRVIDRWYERDGGENIGEYSLFRTRPR